MDGVSYSDDNTTIGERKITVLSKKVNNKTKNDEIKSEETQ